MDTLELGLKDKIVIVTGGNDGLGRACVERFARSGAKVATCARRKALLESVAEEVAPRSGRGVRRRRARALGRRGRPGEQRGHVLGGGLRAGR
jgi:NAD(P)-dependent dehydrogenase (short-subunit alcohol dehydrogenase family)